MKSWVLILSLLHVYPVVAADPLAERDERITRIVRAGGVFTFDNKNKSRPPITLTIRRISEKTLEDIASLETLRKVSCGAADDDDLKMFATLPLLRELDVSGAGKLTNAGIQHLESATKIEALTVRSEDITNDCLSSFGKLPKLTFLNIGLNKQFDDDGIKLLKDCRSLKALNLRDTAVSGSGFSELRGLPHLEQLALGSNRIDDSSLAALVGCTEIKALSLDSVAATDVGLRHLEKMPNLKELRITGSGSLTSEGIKAYKRKRPQVRVD